MKDESSTAVAGNDASSSSSAGDGDHPAIASSSHFELLGFFNDDREHKMVVGLYPSNTAFMLFDNVAVAAECLHRSEKFVETALANKVGTYHNPRGEFCGWLLRLNDKRMNPFLNPLNNVTRTREGVSDNHRMYEIDAVSSSAGMTSTNDVIPEEEERSIKRDADAAELSTSTAARKKYLSSPSGNTRSQKAADSSRPAAGYMSTVFESEPSLLVETFSDFDEDLLRFLEVLARNRDSSGYFERQALKLKQEKKKVVIVVASDNSGLRTGLMFGESTEHRGIGGRRRQSQVNIMCLYVDPIVKPRAMMDYLLPKFEEVCISQNIYMLYIDIKPCLKAMVTLLQEKFGFSKGECIAEKQLFIANVHSSTPSSSSA